MNYHIKQQIIEKRYNKQLLLLLSVLLNELDNLSPLTEAAIKRVITRWITFNQMRLFELTRDNVRDLSQLA